MKHTLQIAQLRKRITIANVINSLCLVLLCLLDIAAVTGIIYSQKIIGSLIDTAEHADMESYMGGYQLVGGVFGAGAIAILVGLLYLLVGITFLYLVTLVIENIQGYRLVSRLKKEAYGEVLMRKTRKNAIFKLIVALLVILPSLFASYIMETWELLAFIIPQTVVLILAIIILRSLPTAGERPEPRPPLGEEP